MAIVKMKKIRLLASRTDREAILRDLMLMGCLEVSSPDELLEDEELAELVGRENADFDRYNSESLSLARGLDIIRQYVPAKTPMFAERPEVSNDRLLDENDSETYLALAKSLESLDGKIRRLQTEESNIRGLIESLEPWESLDIPLNSEGTVSSSVILGAVASSVEIDTLREEMREASVMSELYLVSSNREQHYLCIICLRDGQTDISEILRRYNFSVTSLKNLRGTAAHNIKGANGRLLEIEKEKAELEAQIIEAAEQKEALRLCYDHIGTKIARADAAGKLLNTEYSLLLTGWVTAPSESKLSDTLSKYTCAWELSDPTPEESEDVPIALKNNAMTRPLTMVTEMFSLPAYNGIDPNPLILPFFTIFFGIMFADMGYGLMLLIFGFLGGRLIKRPRGMLKYTINLLKLCGVTTIVFGFLFGGFFGNVITAVSEMFGREPIELWAIIDPMEDPMTLLIASFVAGAIHVFAGMVVQAYMLIRDGSWKDALFDVGSWWLLFAGIAVGVVFGNWLICIAGALALILTQGRSKPTIVGKLVSGLGSLYDITGYFGDILSYTRLMALMLASGVIATVINTLGTMPGNIIVFAIIFIVGHSFNMGINIIGTYVHSARLQYLEFFGKFYKDGGKPFKPLAVNTKYVDMIKEEN